MLRLMCQMFINNRCGTMHINRDRNRLKIVQRFWLSFKSAFDTAFLGLLCGLTMNMLIVSKNVLS